MTPNAEPSRSADLYRPTAAEARNALATVESTSLAHRRDRRVHALATAGFGLLIGGYVGLGRLDREDGSGPLSLFVYLGLLVLLALWQTRASATLPRGARWACRSGVVGTLVVAAVAQMWLNWREQTTASGALLLTAVSLAIALPMLLAAAAIMWRGER